MTFTELKNGVGDSLRERQFRARGSNWFRTTADVVQVANLQKSRFGNQFYLNMALWAKQIRGPDFPSENKCQVRARVAAFVPRNTTLINNQIFNLDSTLTREARATGLSTLVAAVVVPFFEFSSNLEWVREHYAAGRFRGLWILSDQLGWPAITQDQPAKTDVSFFVDKNNVEILMTLEGLGR